MPFIDRPEKLKIGEGHDTIDGFLMNILRVIKHNDIYGMYVVLFDKNQDAHGYQFGLRKGDYKYVGRIANKHIKIETGN